MNPRATAVALSLIAVLAAAVHGVGGELLVVRKLSPGALPASRFGGPRMTMAMIHAAWHLTTIAFLTVGAALLLAGSVLDGDAALDHLAETLPEVEPDDALLDGLAGALRVLRHAPAVVDDRPHERAAPLGYVPRASTTRCPPNHSTSTGMPNAEDSHLGQDLRLARGSAPPVHRPPAGGGSRGLPRGGPVRGGAAHLHLRAHAGVTAPHPRADPVIQGTG